jgi:hypothetical protein
MDVENQKKGASGGEPEVRCTALVGLPRDVLNTVAAEWCVDIFRTLTWQQACQYKPLLGAWQTGAEIVRAYSPTGESQP